MQRTRRGRIGGLLAIMLAAPSCSAVQSGAARGSNETEPPLIAIGVLSAPHFVERRDSLRSSWMQSSLVGRGRLARVLFVVRAQGMPSSLDCQLAVEQRVNDDIMRVATVPWNESRLRGPVLSLAAWLEFAAQEFDASPFVAKMDDDAYLHVADLLVLLRTTARANGPNPHAELTYMGAMSWFHSGLGLGLG